MLYGRKSRHASANKYNEREGQVHSNARTRANRRTDIENHSHLLLFITRLHFKVHNVHADVRRQTHKHTYMHACRKHALLCIFSYNIQTTIQCILYYVYKGFEELTRGYNIDWHQRVISGYGV